MIESMLPALNGPTADGTGERDDIRGSDLARTSLALRHLNDDYVGSEPRTDRGFWFGHHDSMAIAEWRRIN
jgi:hypothetical protein